MGIENFPNVNQNVEKEKDEHEKESDEAFYPGGILNRSLMYRKNKEQPSSNNAEDMKSEVDSNPAFYEGGILNRNFGKEKNEGLLSESANSEVENTNKISKASETMEDSTKISKEPSIEKPIMAEMVEAYTGLSKEPEKKAIDYLYGRLDPHLSEEEKMTQLKKFTEEYREYQRNKTES